MPGTEAFARPCSGGLQVRQLAGGRIVPSILLGGLNNRKDILVRSIASALIAGGENEAPAITCGLHCLNGLSLDDLRSSVQHYVGGVQVADEGKTTAGSVLSLAVLIQ